MAPLVQEEGKRLEVQEVQGLVVVLDLEEVQVGLLDQDHLPDLQELKFQSFLLKTSTMVTAVTNSGRQRVFCTYLYILFLFRVL